MAAASLSHFQTDDGQPAVGSYRLTARSWRRSSGIPPQGLDLWVLPLKGTQAPQPFLRTRFTEVGPKFSPDGRWIAYVSDESGQYEVYVRPYPGPRRQVAGFHRRR